MPLRFLLFNSFFEGRGGEEGGGDFNRHGPMEKRCILYRVKVVFPSADPNGYALTMTMLHHLFYVRYFWLVE